MVVDVERLATAGGGREYPEYPVLRRIALEGAWSRAGFAFEVRLALAELHDVACLPTASGMAVVAASEAELDRAIARLRELHAEQLVVGPPVVRLRDTGRGREVPVMGLQVRCPPNHVERVRRDLQRRGAAIVEASSGEHFGVVRASVALAAILGYARQLHELTRGAGRSVCWLERYEPLPDGDDAA